MAYFLVISGILISTLAYSEEIFLESTWGKPPAKVTKEFVYSRNPEFRAQEPVTDEAPAPSIQMEKSPDDDTSSDLDQGFAR